MPSSQAKKIREQILSEWSDKRNSLDACLAIFEYLEGHVSTAKHLTHGFLTKLGKRNNISSPEKMLEAAKYLSGPEIHLLDMRFEFIDEHGMWREPYEVQQIKDFIEGEEFVNPMTGLVDPDYQKKLYLFFSASKFAEEAFDKK